MMEFSVDVAEGEGDMVDWEVAGGHRIGIQSQLSIASFSRNQRLVANLQCRSWTERKAIRVRLECGCRALVEPHGGRMD